MKSNLDLVEECDRYFKKSPSILELCLAENLFKASHILKMIRKGTRLLYLLTTLSICKADPHHVDTFQNGLWKKCPGLRNGQLITRQNGSS